MGDYHCRHVCQDHPRIDLNRRGPAAASAGAAARGSVPACARWEAVQDGDRASSVAVVAAEVACCYIQHQAAGGTQEEVQDHSRMEGGGEGAPCEDVVVDQSRTCAEVVERDLRACAGAEGLVAADVGWGSELAAPEVDAPLRDASNWTGPRNVADRLAPCRRMAVHPYL